MTITNKTVEHDKFFELLKKNDDYILFHNCSFAFDIQVVENRTFHLLFHYCIFKGRVRFSGQFRHGLEFKNCDFKYDLKIENCLTDYQDNWYTSNTHSIVLDNTSHGDEILIFESNLSRGIFLNQVKSQVILINNVKIEKRGLEITNTDVGGNGYFEMIASNSGISILDSTFHEKASFKDLDIKFIKLQQSTFKGSTSIYRINAKHLSLSKSSFDAITVKSLNISSTFSIVECTSKKPFYLSNHPEKNECSLQCKIKHLTIGRNIFLQGLNISDLLNLKHFQIDFDVNSSGTFQVNNIKTKSICLEGFLTKSYLILENITVDNFTIRSFSNKSIFKINSLKANSLDSMLEISKSNLSNSEFQNTNFDRFSQIVISESNISELKTSNVVWFKQTKLSTEKQLLGNKREVFKQIKYSLERQGDRINALDFKNYELSAYRKELFSGIPWFKIPFEKERFILLISWWSNNFGLNWWRPVWLALVLGLITWFLVVIGISESMSLSFDSTRLQETLDEFGAYFNKFFSYMNPTHSLSRMFPETYISWKVYAVDYIFRIILAYLIVQTVTAFRKYIT